MIWDRFSFYFSLMYYLGWVFLFLGLVLSASLLGLLFRVPVLVPPEFAFLFGAATFVILLEYYKKIFDYLYSGAAAGIAVVVAFFLLFLCHLLSLRNIIAVFSQKIFLKKSLLLSIVRRISKGRKLGLKQFYLLLTALLFALFSAYYLVLLTMMIFRRCPMWLVLLLSFGFFFFYAALLLSGKHSLTEDTEKILHVIKESAAGQFPKINPLPASSVLYECGEDVLRLGKLTEEGIEKGIAGEKLKVELITNVSHDLRTPLTSVIGYAEALEKEELPEKAKEISGKLLYKARYLNELVRDLFDLSKTASGAVKFEKDEVDLNRLLLQTAAEMQDRIEASGFTIVKRLSTCSMAAVTDGTRLHRVVQNLIDNALKYALPGTRIFLSTAREGEKLTLSVLNTASYALDPDIDLTERFTRGDSSRTGEGSGLGLAIAKTYMEAAGGSFDIRIRGDQFEAVLSLPAMEEEK